MNMYFVYADGHIVTPETGTILEGITRSAIIELAGKLGHQVEERKFSIDEWRDGVASGEITEVFACGTAAVVTPVGTLKWDGGEVGRPPTERRTADDGDPPGPGRHPVRPRRGHLRLDAPGLLTPAGRGMLPPRASIRPDGSRATATGVADDSDRARARTLVGNRWVLVGGVVYLLEWVAIIWVGPLGVGETVIAGHLRRGPRRLLRRPPGRRDAMAGWFAVVLLGPDPAVHRPAPGAGRLGLPAPADGLRGRGGRGQRHARGRVLRAGAPPRPGSRRPATRAGMLAIDQAAAGLNLMIAGGLGVGDHVRGVLHVALRPVPDAAQRDRAGLRASRSSAPSSRSRRRCETLLRRPASSSRCCSGSGCCGPACSAGGVRRAARRAASLA